MPFKDKKLQKKSAAKHYLKNKKKMKARARAFTLKARERNRTYVTGYKVEHGCTCCPMRHPRCLEFHHTKNKKANVSDAVNRGWSIERLQAEIDKCILLCANCHRLIDHPSEVRTPREVEYPLGFPFFLRA